MSFSNPTPRICLFLLLIAVLSSCVKDIDLDQANNITAQPDLEVDLFYLELDQVGFSDILPGNMQTILSDTVRLEFLRDQYIQRDLREVEFSFRYLNSFPQSFKASIIFLSEDNILKHRIPSFIIDSGTDPFKDVDPPHLIEEGRIGEIRESIKMVVEIEAVEAFSPPVTGALKIQSKGLFSFNFNL